MTTASEEILAREARYNRTEMVIDKLGRMITVRRLRPSQRLRVEEFAGALDGTDKLKDKDGKVFEVPKALPLMMAAAVVKIDEGAYTFAKSREELDSIYDRLDSEGMAAVAEGLAKLAADDAAAGEEVSEDTPKN